MNITTAGDLARADPARIRHHFSLLLQRTVLELRGIPAIKLDDFDAISGSRKQQIMCSRMFGHPITGLPDLSAAVSTYAQQAAVRLRRQGSLHRHATPCPSPRARTTRDTRPGRAR
jgi:DNA polymerase V